MIYQRVSIPQQRDVILRALRLLPVILGFLCVSSGGETLRGVIGDTELAFETVRIEPGKHVMLAVKKSCHLLQIREVYPDAPNQPTYKYDIRVNGRLVYVREHQGTGFGPVSFFMRLPSWAQKTRSIEIVNRGTSPVRIANIIPTDVTELAAIEKSDKFGLYGVLVTNHGWDRGKEYVQELAAKMPSKPGFYRGFAFELPYASLSIEKIAELIDSNLLWAKEYDLTYLPGFTSWWAATPLTVPDGDGGVFGDVKYQQICWSPEDIEDSSELRHLLGDRYNIHYGLSIPNQWSNCPWLTMNHPKLNAYRCKTLTDSVRILASKIKGSGIRLEGIYLENEPRYWDSFMEAGNPRSKRKTVWADFNPVVVADALKDGVALDPSDGLDKGERLWLHRNVARYNQTTVDWVLQELKLAGLRTSVYTHSLQLLGFPGDEIGHPMSEFAYVKGALVGLEGMWTKLADFERVREWGPWANVNREENDGRDIKEHLWDLRVTYARGGKLYNSYNWQAIGSDRVFGYMKEFIDTLPQVEMPVTIVQKDNKRRLTFATTSLDVQGANLARISITLTGRIPCALLGSVRNAAGRTVGFSRAEGPFETGTHTIEFWFSEPFEFRPGERGTFHIWAEDQAYNRLIEITESTFLFDLRRERNQSLMIIARAEKGRLRVDCGLVQPCTLKRRGSLNVLLEG